jgi:type IV pilus assembly protein PilV
MCIKPITPGQEFYVQKKDKKNLLVTCVRGFTLIEIMIALAIFSIGILAVAKMQLSSSKNTTTGNITTVAAMLARDKMEELKSEDIATLVTGNYNDPNNPVDQNGDAGGIFTRSWEITNPLGGTDSRQIQVTVRFSRRGRTRRVQLETITRGNGT